MVISVTASSLALAPLPARAATMTVAPGEVVFEANGLCSLREAVANANDDAHSWLDCPAGSGSDAIELPPGNYHLAVGRDAAPIPVTSPILIMGDDLLPRPALDGGSSFRHFEVGTVGHLSIDHLWLKNGAETEFAAAQQGGAIRSAGSVLVEDSLLTGNAAKDAGGAIFSSGSLTVSNSTLSDNQADGGGATWSSGSLTVMNSTLSDNVALFGSGGAVFNSGSSSSVTNSTMIGNASDQGGAIFNSGSLAVANSTLNGNSSGDGSGGAIFSFGSSLTVMNSTMNGNASGQGGAIFSSSLATVTNSTLDGNHSGDGSGGAIFSSGELTLTNSTLSDNSGNFGGAVFNSGATGVENSTLHGNSSTSPGGAIASLGPGSVAVTNSTLSENHAMDGGGAIWNSGSLTLTGATLRGNRSTDSVAGFDDCVGGSCPSGIDNQGTATARNTILDLDTCSGAPLSPSGTNNLETALVPPPDDQAAPAATCGGAAGFTVVGDVLLGSLQNNGGPTETHALLPGSPAINAGNQQLCNTRVSGTDQRGFPRTVGPRCDVGAVEMEPLRLLDSLIEFVMEVVAHEGVRAALQEKLINAQDLVEAGEPLEASEKVGAFRNHVRAQKGKRIGADDADRMLIGASQIREILESRDGREDDEGQT